MARSIFHDVSSLPWKGPSGVKVLKTEADVLAHSYGLTDEEAEAKSTAPAEDPPADPPAEDPPADPPAEDPPSDDESSEDDSGSDSGSQEGQPSAPAKGRRGRRGGG